MFSFSSFFLPRNSRGSHDIRSSDSLNLREQHFALKKFGWIAMQTFPFTVGQIKWKFLKPILAHGPHTNRMISILSTANQFIQLICHRKHKAMQNRYQLQNTFVFFAFNFGWFFGKWSAQVLQPLRCHSSVCWLIECCK